MRFIKKHIASILLVMVFVVGLGVLIYPTVSNYVNSFTQSGVVVNYNQQINKISDTDYTTYVNQAQAYNATLLSNPSPFTFTDAETKVYDNLLNVGGNEIMGILDIPKINVTLPIYHGTDVAVLQVGIGHLEGSSLPIGGPGTHCVLSGHTGLPSAQLLTNLDKMQIGDRFTITVLGELLTYEVDQISVVLPNDMSKVGIVPGKDYVTLETCTPYGVNDHRLLVRGHRVDNGIQLLNVRVNMDARQVDMSAARVLGIAGLLVAFIAYVAIKYRKKNEGSEWRT